MKNKGIIFYILLFAFNTVLAQPVNENRIKGVVLDSASHLPIEFVSLSTGSSGSVSNENGNFVIHSLSMPSELCFTHIGYKSKCITLNNHIDSIIVLLSAADSLLPEIVISKNEALTIMINAFNKAKNNIEASYVGKGYLRQVIKESGAFTGLQEVFFDGAWQNFGLNRWKPVQARYVNTENSSIVLSNFSFLSFVSSGYLSNNFIRFPVAQKPDSLYTFQLEKYISLDGEADVAVIICTPKPGYKKGIFSGKFYISTTTSQILKTEGSILNLQFNLSGPLRMRDIEIKTISQYKKKSKDESVLDFADIAFYAKASFGFITARKISYSSKLLMYDYSEMSKTDSLIIVNAGSNDLASYRSTLYDAKFWEDNPIIQRTSEEENIIKKFEKEKKVSNFLH